MKKKDLLDFIEKELKECEHSSMPEDYVLGKEFILTKLKAKIEEGFKKESPQ